MSQFDVMPAHPRDVVSGLTDAQARDIILAHVHEKGRQDVDPQSIRKAIGWPKTYWSRQVEVMIKSGAIQRTGERAGTRYHVDPTWRPIFDTRGLVEKTTLPVEEQKRLRKIDNGPSTSKPKPAKVTPIRAEPELELPKVEEEVAPPPEPLAGVDFPIMTISVFYDSIRMSHEDGSRLLEAFTKREE